MHPRSWRGPVAALLVVSGAAGADPSVSPEELRRLEESLGTVPAPAGPPAETPPPAGSLTNPEIAAILDVAGAYYSTPEPLPAGGHDPAATGFAFQQLELALGAAADPYLRFDGNLVFGPSGVEVEEAYATTLALPANLQLRAGQFLSRFGRINPTHPHRWSFVDLPIAAGRYLGPEGSRGIGVEGAWLAPLPWFAEVIVAAQGPGEAHLHDHDGEEEPAGEHGVEDLGDLVYTVALKQFFPLGEDVGLLFGVSTQQGPDPLAPGGRSSLLGADLHLRYRPVASTDRAALTLQLEGFRRVGREEGETLRDHGGYAQLVWSIDPAWETGVRYEWVSGLANEHLAPAEFGARRRAAAQLTHYPSHFSRLRLQVNRDDPLYRTKAFWAAFLQLEVTVGAHGSHAY